MQRERSRGGMSLLEIVVVIAIGLALGVVVIGGVMSGLRLEEHRFAKDLALSYELLHDEAVLRNVTFRVAYHLDGQYYTIESGDPATLIFDDPEKREDYEKELADKLRRFTKRELAEGKAPKENKFAKLKGQFKDKYTLPVGIVFGGAYTPQYGEWIEPSGEEEDPEEPLIVYSYIFPNGFVEHTVVQLVHEDNAEAGYTIEVEPLSGKVHLHDGAMDYRDSFRGIPDRGPELSN